MTTTRRLLVVPAVVVLLVSCSSDKSSDSGATTALASTTSTTSGMPDTSGSEKPVSGDAAEIVVNVGKDDSPDRVEHVTVGQTVELRLLSDGDEDYHVEGYDLDGKAAAGVEFDFEFIADKTGLFKVTSGTSDDILLVLSVS
jgi:hypothetical protein